MSSSELSTPNNQAATSNKNKTINEASGNRKGNKDIEQLKLAYPSPEQTPPTKSVACGKEPDVSEQAATPSPGTQINEDFILFPGAPAEYEEYGYSDISVQAKKGSLPSYGATAREEPAAPTMAPSTSYDTTFTTIHASTHHTIDPSVYAGDLFLVPNYGNTGAVNALANPLGRWVISFDRAEVLTLRLGRRE